MHPIISAALADEHRDELLRRAARAQRVQVARDAARRGPVGTRLRVPWLVRRAARVFG